MVRVSTENRQKKTVLCGGAACIGTARGLGICGNGNRARYGPRNVRARAINVGGVGRSHRSCVATRDDSVLRSPWFASSRQPFQVRGPALRTIGTDASIPRCRRSAAPHCVRSGNSVGGIGQTFGSATRAALLLGCFVVSWAHLAMVRQRVQSSKSAGTHHGARCRDSFCYNRCGRGRLDADVAASRPSDTCGTLGCGLSSHAPKTARQSTRFGGSPRRVACRGISSWYSSPTRLCGQTRTHRSSASIVVGFAAGRGAGCGLGRGCLLRRNSRHGRCHRPENCSACRWAHDQENPKQLVRCDAA